jgi:MerR family transcriptional regulator, mercuric resistance operon regulatory protein
LTRKRAVADDASWSGSRSKTDRERLNVKDRRPSKELRFAISDAARLTGVSVETIRYYERIALLPRPPRTPAGRRAFDGDGLQTLTFVKRSRELGFSLDDIRVLLALRASPSSCGSVKALAARHLEVVRGKLKNLRELEAGLSEIVALCPGGESNACPILDVLDAKSDAKSDARSPEAAPAPV